jgi:hypothetical protein
MAASVKRSIAAFLSVARRVVWLGAAATAVVGSSPALSSAPNAPLQHSATKSIPDRVAAVREQITREGKAADGSVFYRMSQFFNFPNFPKFSNFPNFPNFANFPNFPNFPKF